MKLTLILALCLTITGCYPFFHYQSPELLPKGDDVMGAGISMMSNVYEFSLDTLGNEQTFLADFTYYYRQGITDKLEMGVKLVDWPWNTNFVMLDAKYGILQEDWKLAVDLGISYWRYAQNSFVIGYHPTLLLGKANRHGSLQVNYLRSADLVYLSYDVVLGARFYPEEEHTSITPHIGLHLGHEHPKEFYYSLGLSFSTPFYF